MTTRANTAGTTNRSLIVDTRGQEVGPIHVLPRPSRLLDAPIEVDPRRERS
jgi:hypothetical protein